MARPRSFEADVVADGLLQAFWSHGYSRTSIGHLTAATGLLPGSLYAAFGSKEAMFRVAVDRYAGQLAAAVADDATGIEGLQAILDTVVRLTTTDAERRGCLILNAIPEAAALGEETRTELQRGLRGMQRLLRARVQEAVGRAAKDEIDGLAAVAFAAAVSIRVLGRAGQDRRLLQSIADGATAAVRRAARPR